MLMFSVLRCSVVVDVFGASRSSWVCLSECRAYVCCSDYLLSFVLSVFSSFCKLLAIRLVGGTILFWTA
jgi:hypothetical protein